MINFTRAFELAWERTMVILFRPFDLEKWFVIGFSAFLALLAEGGVSFDNPISFQTQNNKTYESLPAALHALKQGGVWLHNFMMNPRLGLWITFALIYLLVWLALNWVGCRGEFVLLDNIVRNRGALAWPWQRYARQGNIWFLVQLGLVGVSCVLGVFTALAFFTVSWTWINAERSPNSSEIGMLIGVAVLVVAVWMVFAVVAFLLRSFVLPLYFKQSMSLGQALLAVGRLIVTHPVSVVAYLLVNLLLAFASGLLTAAISCLFCCVICWVACIPFLGSMLLSFVLCQMLLPIVIFCGCFQLDCLAQFGPQYDVWTVDVPPTEPTSLSSFSPQPPLG